MVACRLRLLNAGARNSGHAFATCPRANGFRRGRCDARVGTLASAPLSSTRTPMRVVEPTTPLGANPTAVALPPLPAVRQPGANPPVALLPLPAVCQLGALQPLTGPVQLIVQGDVPAALTRRLQSRWRRSAGWPLLLCERARDDADGASADTLRFAGSVALALEAMPRAANGDTSDEGYQLRVSGTDARLVAAHADGLKRGIETLLQLVTGAGVTECVIDDAPRFAYRGVMLDPARHFLPPADVLRVLDGMAALKLNVLHLHLSDDQGFRLESRALPRLSAYGSDGEFYTQEEIRELVRHAADLGIRVIPELDMPGHCQSWLVGYPQLAPLPRTWQLRRQFGIGRASLDPTREETYVFLDELLGEVAALFPDPLVHIGGDEVHPKAWEGVPHIAAFMHERGMQHARELQGYFTARVARILARHGRRMVAWDEVLTAPLPEPTAVEPRQSDERTLPQPSAARSDADTNLRAPARPGSPIIQAWRSGAARDQALRAGADVIVSSGYYFDLFYPAHAHYDFDPEAGAAELHRWEDGLADRPGFETVGKTIGAMFGHFRRAADHTATEIAPTGRVIGGEACLWGELVMPELLDLRLFSRLTALAERLWSPATVRDHDDFYRRHERVMARLEAELGLQLAGVRAAHGPTENDRRQVLLDTLEPVKWYARLLGPDLLASRALGEPDPPLRPYDATTPLQRIADRIAPESIPARRFTAACAHWRATGDITTRANLLTVAQAWQDQAQQWEALGPPVDCDGLAPLARRLGELGSALAAVLHDRVAQLERTVQPPCADLFLVVERDVLRLIEDAAR